MTSEGSADGELPPGWTIRPTTRFSRQLRRLDRQIAARIVRELNRVAALPEGPRSTGKALVGPLSGLWRYRVGDYRILCELHDDELVILALTAEHRSQAYD